MNSGQAKVLAKFISSSSYGKMSWKNGQGVTEEIAKEITDSARADDGFRWRLSAAQISQSSVFSSYLGCERLLTLISGDEIILHSRAEKKTTRLRAGEVFQFSGDQKIEAELSAGPVKDLGLIFNRQQVSASMSLISVGKKPRSFSLQAPTTLIYLVSGALRVFTYPGEDLYRLSAHDTLHVFPGPQGQERLVLLENEDKESRLIFVEIAPIIL